MKYRIVEVETPKGMRYRLEEKDWFVWVPVNTFESLSRAESEMNYLIYLDALTKPGKVVKRG